MSSPIKLSQRETTFNQEVVTRFELYNSLFQTLPFYQVKDTGIYCLFLVRIAKRRLQRIHRQPKLLNLSLKNMFRVSITRSRLTACSGLYNILKGRWFYLMPLKIHHLTKLAAPMIAVHFKALLQISRSK